MVIANIKRNNFYLFFIPVFFYISQLSAQNMQRVTHLSGSQIINDINVTVTSSGMIPKLNRPTHCSGDTGPYYMGYNTVDYSCATGSYTFTFSPPVSNVTLNFSGLSTSDQYNEEVMLYVNGHHYKIDAVGTKNSCEDVASLTPAGNITGCEGCPSSGWNNTIINGPIYTLTIIDSVLLGEPAGVLFALYMNCISLEENLDSRIHYYKQESSAGSALIIEADQTDLKLMSVLNPKGEKMIYYSYSQDPAISIDITGFKAETEYTFEFMINDHLLSKKIMVR